MSICDSLPTEDMKRICNGTAIVNGNPITPEITAFYLDQWRGFGIIEGTSTEPSVAAKCHQLPPLWIRGVNFARAMSRWVAAGRPMRTTEQIEERLAICQSCPFFNGSACSKCGCGCSAESSVLNKLALETEKCPEGKWA